MSVIALDTTIDHIRKRPGMYLGSTNVNGLKELFYNLFQDHLDFEHDFNLKIIIKKNNDFIISLEEKPVRTHTSSNHMSYNYSIITIAAVSKTFLLNGLLISNHGISNLTMDEIDRMRSEKLEIEFEIDYSVMKDLVVPDFFVFHHMLEHFAFIYNNVSIKLIDERENIERIIHNPNGMIDLLKSKNVENSYYREKDNLIQ